MSILAALEAGQLLAPIDRAIAAFLTHSGASDAVAAAAAWASANARAGHVCVDLHEAPTRALPESTAPHDVDLVWPTIEGWREQLSASPLVSTGDRPTALVLRDNGHLYLQRLWQVEQELAARVRSLAAMTVTRPAADAERLRVYFPDDAIDQRRAAEVASRSGLTLLCGGPGTGKTTTVCRLLALAIEAALQAGLRPPRIRLLAPTGKAAARLAEAVVRNRAHALIPDAVRAYIPEHAETLHRALGLRPDGGAPRFGVDRPLPVDLLVVDEASMVDLESMLLVLRALPPGAQLVLLGDRHQLASVEAGAVLAELTRSARLQPCLVELLRNRRFAEGGAIADLARAIVAADPEAALAVLRQSTDARLHTTAKRKGARDIVIERSLVGYRAALTAPHAAAALEALGELRVLAAHRRGLTGAVGLNRRIERALVAHNLVRRVGDAMLGRPILVSTNDYNLGLRNGDVGITWLTEHGVRACFLDDGELRALAPSRLPPHEPVYAMTVHKSQGSEWKRVVLVLPEEPSPILTRELLYTAVTRAGEQVVIVGSADLVRHAILTPTRRKSGLAAAIDA